MDDGQADPRALTPGTVMRHVSSFSGGDNTVTLDRRKDDDTGWWNTNGSGLIDSVILDGSWVVEPPDEIEHQGHKVYVTRDGDWVVMGAVNDDRPLVRMTFRLGVEDAEDIVTLLREAIDRGN